MQTHCSTTVWRQDMRIISWTNYSQIKTVDDKRLGRYFCFAKLIVQELKRFLKNCWLSDLCLYLYEAECIQSLVTSVEKILAKSFHSNFYGRYNNIVDKYNVCACKITLGMFDVPEFAILFQAIQHSLILATKRCSLSLLRLLFSVNVLASRMLSYR